MDAVDPQTKARFSMEYRVPYADTDQMGVVYYANYFVYFERTRNEVLRGLGLPYREIEAQGWMLPVIESHCEHRLPAAYDDLLTLTAWFEALGATRIRACCEVSRDGRILAHGYTVHVCLNATSRRPSRLPPALRKALACAGNFPPDSSSA